MENKNNTPSNHLSSPKSAKEEVNEKPAVTWLKQITDNIKQIAILSFKEFTKGRTLTKVSALTYNTLLSIIPLLALLFAIARGFDLANLLEHQLTTGLERESVATQTILRLVNSYLDHTKGGLFIGVGLIMLFWTTLSLTNNIEETFNYIWQVKKGRRLYRKATDYFSVLLLLPILFVLSGGISLFMTTLAQEMSNFKLLTPLLKIAIKSIPYLLTWGMFTGLYLFIPNTHVKFRHAIIPGILAGTIFQLFQYFYINSQIWISTYNAIYGSFAAIPMFLLWTQISWSICIFGGILNYVSQNLKQYSFRDETETISRRYNDFLCTLILSLICKRFEKENIPYTAESLSEEHEIPICLTKKIVYQLQDIQLITETRIGSNNEQVAYLPAVDIHTMTLGMLLHKLNRQGSEGFNIKKERYSGAWEAIKRIEEEERYSNSQILLKDL
ncbi:MAG: YihY/virulence factor BrkB family protein [Phocaeicola sp.]